MSFPTDQDAGSSSSLDSQQLCRHFTFSEIQLAAHNFDESLVIGHGGFGKVYKGTIPYGEPPLTVAIKRLDSTADQGAPEFWAEVKMLSDLRHFYLVSLIGYCNEGQEMILVYEYMPNGTLLDGLQKRQASLTWVRRLKICLGAAHGLNYLHSIKPIVIHRDVKSSNILLDRNWAAKISDFGLSKVGPTNQPSITFVKTRVKGSFGYFDPEYVKTGRVTRRSDVYAFGVVMFELLCGKEAVFETLNEEARDLASWAQDSIKEGRLKHIVDPYIRGTISPKCLKEFARLANQCLLSNPMQRPTMATVVVGLESILVAQEKTNNMLLPMDKKIYRTKVPSFIMKIFGTKVPSFIIPSSLVETSSLESPRPCRQLRLSKIQVATQNFDESLVIGHGGFGKVYRGTIIYGESLLTVAIKRMDSTSNQGADEFWAEVEILSKLRHSHLVSLIGYCNDGTEFILVYEYMASGTLASHLHKGRAPLSWVQKLKICLGAARGIDYLHIHTSSKQGVIHRDVKSSNILLDENWVAKISDFGLLKVVPTDNTSVNTMVRGTFGYLDPYYYQTGRLTRKSDVYAFGVVMFELLCGKQAIDESLDDDQWGLANWAQDSIKNGRLKQIIDHNLRGIVSNRCLKEFAQLANQCLHSNSKQRPTMAEVVVGLESILATQEKTSNALLPTNKKIFGRKVPSFLIPSIRENSVGSSKSLDMYLYSIGGEDRILRRCDFKTILDATEHFSLANKVVGHLFHHSVYKGKLQNGQHITIVQYGPDASLSGYEGCMDEASIHVKFEHENLLHMLGYCVEGRTVYLIYDFAPYAQLDHLIFDPDCGPLDWNARYKIILGVARALVYLHNHAPVRIIHCDVKPRNILLNEKLEPKLFDFHFAISKEINESDDIEMEIIRGTAGYAAPEVFSGNHVSTKADVFSFGVLVIVTITGRRAFDRTHEMLLEYVWRNWKEGTCSNIIDPKINIDGNVSSITKLMHIGLLCVQDEAMDRPTMEEVVSMMLESSSAPLPNPEEPTIKEYLFAPHVNDTSDSDGEPK